METTRGSETTRTIAVRRGKGCGRVFARGGVWYLRYRANGIERTRSTRIEVDTLTPHRLEASRRKALAVLNEETEVLRLKDRESGLRIVRSMLEDTRERLRDSMEEVRRNAPLDLRDAVRHRWGAASGRPDARRTRLATDDATLHAPSESGHSRGLRGGSRS